MEETLLQVVKKALMIPETETFADDELQAHIDGCKELLKSAGAKEAVVESVTPMVKGLIIIYVKTYYGFKNDGSVKELPSSFDMLLRQLVLSNGDNSNVS